MEKEMPHVTGSDSAMRYESERQTVAPGECLHLGVLSLHAPAGTIRGSGETGLYLEPGRYLAAFCCNACGEENGVALWLNESELSFARGCTEGRGQLCLQILLNLTGPGVLTVRTLSARPALVRQAVLTVLSVS